MVTGFHIYLQDAMGGWYGATFQNMSEVQSYYDQRKSFCRGGKVRISKIVDGLMDYKAQIEYSIPA